MGLSKRKAASRRAIAIKLERMGLYRPDGTLRKFKDPKKRKGPGRGGRRVKKTAPQEAAAEYAQAPAPQLVAQQQQQQQQHDEAEVVDLTSDDEEAEVTAGGLNNTNGLAGQPVIPGLLPLLATKDPAEMEQQLQQLVNESLRRVLPHADILDLMRQLLSFFEPFVAGNASARSLGQLHTGYVYVQAAVEGGDVAEVVRALRALMRRT